jgi:hypothetical protein
MAGSLISQQNPGYQISGPLSSHNLIIGLVPAGKRGGK